jgi:benzoylformate decarboxylase
MGIMTGRQSIMEIMRAEEVKYIFGLHGITESYFMDALEDYPDIQYILGLHEVVCAGMAEGYARTSGKPGVLNLHTGTGLSAALPMLCNAYKGGVPLVVTVGQQDKRLLAYEPDLAADIVRIGGPVTKWATEINYASEISTIFRRAFRVAAHPPTGPVLISLPQNIMNDTLDFEYEKGAPTFTASHPDERAIEIAVDLLAGAKNPAIIVEDGVAKGDALSEVVELAELLGARVYQPWMADVNFPLNHPLYAGDLNLTSLTTRRILEKIDVLVVIGALFFSQPLYLPESLVPPGLKIIQIDNNPWQIGKNIPVSSGIEADIKVAVSDLIQALSKEMKTKAVQHSKSRTMIISQEKAQADKQFAEIALKERNNLPISVTRLMQEIKDNIKPGTRIVDDSWTCSSILRRTMGFSEPKSFQRARGAGSIGWGLPGALGVKLASPDHPVVSICGDGSAMWSIQSLWTAARYNIPVTFIICVNNSYKQVRVLKHVLMGQKAMGRYLGTDLSNPQNDFCKIAEGMGIEAYRVKKPEQLKPSLKSAFKADKPNLVEVYLEC